MLRCAHVHTVPLLEAFVVVAQESIETVSVTVSHLYLLPSNQHIQLIRYESVLYQGLLRLCRFVIDNVHQIFAS